MFIITWRRFWLTHLFDDDRVSDAGHNFIAGLLRQTDGVFKVCRGNVVLGLFRLVLQMTGKLTHEATVFVVIGTGRDPD